jgi:NAD(P)-dependent dehydrogenase (short-subunit alcohol dehydrogenase family)
MQRVLITAGASGIGREMVHAFAAAGAKVGVVDIDAPLLETLRVSHPAVITELCDLADRAQIEMNLSGTFNVTRLAIPHLKHSRAGSIINMSSAAGRLGYPQRSAYAVSKWGIVGFTKTLSMELGEAGIRANAILPGPVAGPRMDRVLEARAVASGRTMGEERASALVNQSLKNFTQPGEIAALAVFLASDAAKTISGQALSIDGDMHRSV